VTEYYIRNEDEFTRLFIEIIADSTFRWISLENKYRFNCRASAYFAKSQGFVFQGKFDLYLGGYEEGTTFKIQVYCIKIHINRVFSHAVLLRTILSITAQSVWC